MNRSEQIPTHLSKRALNPKEQKLIKGKAPFIDEISGLAIIKILDGMEVLTVPYLIKLKFICNAVMAQKL